MGAGNPFFRFYNEQREYYEVSTYFIQYYDGTDGEGHTYEPGSGEDIDASASNFDWMIEELRSIAVSVGFELSEGFDEDSCAGVRERAMILAEGKYAKLLAHDGDNNRMCFSLVPLKDYDKFCEEIVDDRWYQGWRKEGAAEADAEKRWPAYEKNYQREFNKYMRRVHEEWPAEHTIYVRNGPWMSSAIAPYDKKKPLTFIP